MDKKDSRHESWLGRNLLWLGGGILGLGAVLVSLSPYLFTQLSFGYELSGSMGPLGDAIAGTTAPIVGLVGSALVFLSLAAQYRANQIILDDVERASNRHRDDQQAEKERFRAQQRNQNFSILLDLIRDHSAELSNLSYQVSTGVRDGNRAIRLMLQKVYNGERATEFPLLEHATEGLENVVKLVSEFELDPHQKAVLSSRLLSVIGKLEIPLSTFANVEKGRLGPFAARVTSLSKSAQDLVP